MITTLNYDYRDMKSISLQLLSCIQHLKPLWNNYHYYIKVLYYLYYKCNILFVPHATTKHSFASKPSNLWWWFMVESIIFFTFYIQTCLNVYHTCTWKVKNHFHHIQLLLGCMAKDHLAFVHNPERDLWGTTGIWKRDKSLLHMEIKKHHTKQNATYCTLYQQIFILGTFSNGVQNFGKYIHSNARNT